ncbi:MAG: hypothetical protein QM820_08550 [Minicystis sp.]
MPEVIRRTAAAADIVADVGESYLKAVAKQGKWQILAEEHLGPTVKLVETVAVQLADAQKTALPLVLALQAADEHADRVVGKVSDDVWNAVGRPRSDPALDILFPGGNAFYVDGDVAEQPDRMDLLVELLKAGVHPTLPPAVAQSAANTIQAEGDTLRQAVKAAQGPRTKVTLLERVNQAVARSAALKLAGFKRVLKAAGFSEAEIHTVIPDRGKPAPAKKQAPQTPAAPPTLPAQQASPAPSTTTSAPPQTSTTSAPPQTSTTSAPQASTTSAPPAATPSPAPTPKG